MVKPSEIPVDDEGLRKTLHEKIEQLNQPDLGLLNKVLMQLEVDRLAAELDAAFEQDRREGKLTKEKIEQAIAEHRARHPYKS
jgi:hypothetical protein